MARFSKSLFSNSKSVREPHYFWGSSGSLDFGIGQMQIGCKLFEGGGRGGAICLSTYIPHLSTVTFPALEYPGVRLAQHCQQDRTAFEPKQPRVTQQDIYLQFANVSSIILEVDGTSDTGSETVERSDMEADLATGVEWDTCRIDNVTIVTNIYT